MAVCRKCIIASGPEKASGEPFGRAGYLLQKITMKIEGGLLNYFGSFYALFARGAKSVSRKIDRLRRRVP
jgi:hypothetical protein